MKNVLEIEGVSKKYKNGNSMTTALKHVSFSLKDGESMAVVGPSGSGKSTFLNIIGGLDKPTEGKVIINGKDITKLNDAELSKFRNKTIGFIFQFFNLQDYLKSYENVMIPLLLAGMDAKEAKLKAISLLEKMHMLNRIEYYPKQLSGGEMQRVAVARSLANDPKILLADEPTANLDKASKNNVLDLFDEICGNGVSVVMITHDPSVSSRFKNIMQISDGELIK